MSINQHVFTPWTRFVLAIHLGEAWAWIAVGAVALLLALVGLLRYAAAVVVLAALWRMVWVVVAPLLLPLFLRKLDESRRRAALRLVQVHKFEVAAWLLVAAAYLVLALMHLRSAAIAVLAAAAASQVLAAAVALILHRFTPNRRRQPE